MELEAMLLSNAVDLVITGHLHGYERVHPNKAGNVVSRPSPVVGTPELGYHHPGAPVHLVVGHGGAVQEEKWVDPAPSWSASDPR